MCASSLQAALLDRDGQAPLSLCAMLHIAQGISASFCQQTFLTDQDAAAGPNDALSWLTLFSVCHTRQNWMHLIYGLSQIPRTPDVDSTFRAASSPGPSVLAEFVPFEPRK
ncbi:hypothetical protein DENSPDRAFT_172347 [Dentipellis sp. KUC8613]|nr:hypothetical protein DENSPDRAFT_172347 [Dentipellis sp. KUC8613]